MILVKILLGFVGWCFTLGIGFVCGAWWNYIHQLDDSIKTKEQEIKDVANAIRKLKEKEIYPMWSNRELYFIEKRTGKVYSTYEEEEYERN